MTSDHIPGRPTAPRRMAGYKPLDTPPGVPASDPRPPASSPSAATPSDSQATVDAPVTAKTAARAGSPLRLAVDTSALYFFDPASGASLAVEDLATVST